MCSYDELDWDSPLVPECVAALSPLAVDPECDDDDDDDDDADDEADDSDADALDELVAEPVVVMTGPWLTPSTRTVGLLPFAEFISMVGVPPDEPIINGMAACADPFTASTVMLGNPFCERGK